MIYYIQYFEVIPARSDHRPVTHPCRARFTAHTEITPVQAPPDIFPMYACTPVSFEILKTTRLNEKDFLSDTIGLFLRCSGVSNQNTRTGFRALRNVEITDGREVAKISLWGPHAEQFEADKYMELAKQRPVALLFVGLTARLFGGRLSLQGSPVCRWYADPALLLASQIKERYGATLRQPDWIGAPPSHAAPGMTTVSDLTNVTNPHKAMGSRYTVEIKVKDVVLDGPWWYNACSECKHKTQPNGYQYKCTVPNCTATGAEPRYCLTLTGTDPDMYGKEDEPVVEFIAFGPHAEEMVGAPVDSLIAAGGGNQHPPPPQIQRLCGRTFELRVSVSRGSLHRKIPSFKVDAVNSVTAPPTAQVPSTPDSLQSPVQDREDHAQNESLSVVTTPRKIQTPPPAQTPQDETPTSKRDSSLHDQDGDPNDSQTATMSKRQRKSKHAKKLVMDDTDAEQ